MGIKEFLTKRLWGEPEYVPTWDPQCLRHKLVTIRLPTGWRFTQVEQLEFAATGPDCTVSFRFIVGFPSVEVRNFRPEEVEANRSQASKLVRAIFNADAKEMQGPEGFLWLEAVDAQRKSKRLQIALLNTKPRPAFADAFILHVTCAVPSVTPADVSSQRFDVVRSVLRAAEWS